MSPILQDVTFALRTLRRRRAFTAVAVATIALGIGAATAIYSVVDGVLFRPLPFRDAGKLVAVWQTYPTWRTQPVLAFMWDRIPLSIPEYRDWRAAQTVFTEVGIWTRGNDMLLGGGDAPEMVRVARTSASLLDVLRVSPVIGRYFTPEEDVVGGPPVVLLSHAAWVARYQSSPDVIGRTVRLDEKPYTIIGVLPKGLELDRSAVSGPPPPFWTPMGQFVQDANERGNHSYNAIGRLKPGISMAQAATETDRILRGEATPDTRGVRLDELQVDQTRNVRKPLLMLLGAAGLLLLISCVNVAVLLLGEAAGREQEMAARIALGAGRRRLVAQLLTESVALSALGAIAGTALAFAGTRVLVALAPARIPGLADVGIDLRVLAFTLAVTAATGVIFGFAPALSLARVSPARVFRGSGGQSVAGHGRLQRVLVATELALSLTLLVGAALLTRSLDRLTAVDPGFRADHLLSVRVTLPRTQYGDSTLMREFYRAAAARLSAVPGVTGVTATSTPPFTGGGNSSTLAIEGQDPGEEGTEAQQRTVLPTFFEVMEIPVLAGRSLTEDDRAGAPPVMVISRKEAERDFPGVSPLGKRVRFQGTWWDIVGVVGDTKYATLSTEDRPTVYTSAWQRMLVMGFQVRTSVDPGSVTSAVREALREVAPGVPPATVEIMASLIRNSSAEERYRTMLMSLFGALAAVLAAAGMYGVTSRAVSRRTREIGIRVALGATPGVVSRLFARQTLSGMVAGVLAGLAISLVASRALEPFLFGVAPHDVTAYVGSVALLVVVGVVASWVPARRVSRVQPARVLKTE